MRYFFNDQSVETLNSITLHEALEKEQISLSHTAVAINYKVIPQHLWATTLLHENDKIVVIRASQGG